MMKCRFALCNVVLLAALCVRAAGQSGSTVKHIQPGTGVIASAVWAGDTLLRPVIETFTMLAAVTTNNVAVMWVAIEATTVATAFLVGHRRTRPALEATWKYVVICSVGIALAFLGTVLLYFASLGAGFIIVEVAMIQKFILFLGHPVYSLAVVLFSVLAFSAMGSYLSGRIPDARLSATLMKLLLLLVVLVFVYIVALPPIFYGLVHLARELRIVIAVVLMAPLAMVMGMPMPIGIRILARSAPEIIPWAWGVNGATSVMGSVAALVIAILSGFNQALMVGAGLYLLAMFLISRPKASEVAVVGASQVVEESAGA
jgi:hypothetical protein